MDARPSVVTSPCTERALGPIVPAPRRDGATILNGSGPGMGTGHGRVLLAEVRRLQQQVAHDPRRGVLAALSLSNGPDIADQLGAEVLSTVTSLLAQRLLSLTTEVHLLAVSPLGGVLAAVLCEPAEQQRLGEDIRTACHGFASAAATRIWPVVTVGLRLLDHTPAESALIQVRQTVFETSLRSPGGVRWHNPADPSPPVRRDLSLTSDLAAALQEPDAQLRLVFQPVRDLRTGRVTAVEALLRWEHPEHGTVSPVDAVGVAETSGLIHPLGAWVLDRALRQGAAWWRARRFVTVHVNVSPVELREPTYADSVARALRRHELPSTALLLELTETDLMVGDAEVRRTLDALRHLGVGLGIDDFGTGWSSIGQLLDLPVDTVKVDRSLVTRIDRSPADLDLLRAVLGLLDTAPVEVVVEGVENAAQASALRSLGVRLVQGYHVGRPVAADELTLGGIPGPRRDSA